MSIYGETDAPPTRSPLIDDAMARRALEEAEQEDAERPARPVRRAHTNQAHAIPQQGGTTRRGVPGNLLAVIGGGGIFALFLAISIFGGGEAPPAPAAMPEQAPAVAPASPWAAPTAPPLPTEAPAPAEAPVAAPAEQPVAAPAEQGANYLEPVNPAPAPAYVPQPPAQQAAPVAPAERAPSDLVPLPDEAPPNPGLGSRPKPDTRSQP